MAQDIVSGLFGLTPNEVAQQQWMQTNQAADRFAQLDPMQRSAQMMFKGGSGLAQAGAGMLGIQNPAIAEAEARQAAMSGLDISSPEAIMQRAAQIQDPRLKMQLQMLAQQKAAERQKMAMEAKKIEHEDFRMGEEFEWKKEQKRMELEQRAEAARMRSEDIRLGIEQRRQAAAESAALRRELAMMRMQQSQQQQEKPMPTSALKVQDEALESMSAAANAQETAKRIVGDIESGRLNLGPIANIMNRIKTGVGVSTEESKALATFQTDLEKMRNDILMLHKGVQTEGDAQRAMNIIVQNINDPKVVKAQMEKIADLNDKAVKLQQRRINLIRSEYGKGPIEETAPQVKGGKQKVVDFGSL